MYFYWVFFKIFFFFTFFFFKITRRYAEFSGSLISINENSPNEKLTLILSQLQLEVQNFILRLASEFSQRKEQLILLINNYDLMLNVITVNISILLH
jgi:hypothetical protein